MFLVWNFLLIFQIYVFGMKIFPIFEVYVFGLEISSYFLNLCFLKDEIEVPFDKCSYNQS